ncbi:hypothetical protein TNCV_2923561 [Trichonephila clavipes]|nr:hypothetical protein TNCV_2923561 [Trichonephila clavipes]
MRVDFFPATRNVAKERKEPPKTDRTHENVERVRVSFRPKIPGMPLIIPAPTNIRAMRSSTEGMGVAYPKLFMWPKPDSRHLLFTLANIVWRGTRLLG